MGAGYRFCEEWKVIPGFGGGPIRPFVRMWAADMNGPNDCLQEFMIEVEELTRQQQAQKIDPPLFTDCIPHVQPICQLDSGVYSSFSTDCNSLITGMLPNWQKVSHVQCLSAGVDVGVN